MEQDELDFVYEFHNMAGDLGELLEDRMNQEAETRLRKLAKGHTDLTGASVALEREDKQAITGFPVRARVVVYTRPDYIAGVETATDAMAALKGALSAVERQVREKRDKLRETWKKP
jgi:ribosome-associated translation inhibitor RaiA